MKVSRAFSLTSFDFPFDLDLPSGKNACLPPTPRSFCLTFQLLALPVCAKCERDFMEKKDIED